MLIASRVDEGVVDLDEAAAEQTTLGGREQTKLTLFVTMIDMRGITVNWKL
jgi:hypothetical protein